MAQKATYILVIVLLTGLRLQQAQSKPSYSKSAGNAAIAIADTDVHQEDPTFDEMKVMAL